MKIIKNSDSTIDKNTIIITYHPDNQSTTDIIQSLTTPTITGTFRGTEYILKTSDILFFETDGHKIQAHSRKESYTVMYKLYELEDLLPSNFIRISKSSIVNINQIKSIQKNLTSSSLISFSNSHKQAYVSRHYYKQLVENMRRFNL